MARFFATLMETYHPPEGELQYVYVYIYIYMYVYIYICIYIYIYCEISIAILDVSCQYVLVLHMNFMPCL